MRHVLPLVSLVIVSAAGLVGFAQTAAPAATHPSLQGEWTYNAGASTKTPDLSQIPQRSGDRQDGPYRAGGNGPLGSGGRGMARRGGGGQNVAPPQTAGGGTGGPVTARLDEVRRELQTPPVRLTITQTDQIVVITTDEGRTSRLTPNGKKQKDEKSGVERTTKWEGGKLLNELSGLPSGDVQQVYALDDQVQRRLHVITTLPNRQDPKNPIVLDRIYDGTP